MRNTAHSNEPGGVWWLEWSVDINLSEITDKEKAIELAYQTNPAMGYRIAEKTVLNEFETMSRDGFARERLGWWSPVRTETVDYAIDKAKWDACKSDREKPDGKTAYGVKFTNDGANVTLCGAVIPDIGPARISLIETKPTGYGTQWLADWLNERYSKAACVVIDGRNGADVLVDKISDVWRQKGSVVRPGARDVVTAASMLCNDLNEKTVDWFYGQEILRESAVTAIKRPIGGGWGFGGDNSAPIEAAALALWGAKVSKRNPAKKMRIG